MSIHDATAGDHRRSGRRQGPQVMTVRSPVVEFGSMGSPYVAATNRASAWEASGSQAGSGGVPVGPMSAARHQPNRIRILLLAANPLSTGRLAIEEEARAIAQRLRLSRDRDAFDLITCWAVQPADLLQYLNQYRPHVVHFSGHGAVPGQILMSAGDGDSLPIDVAALAELFRIMRDDIRVVLLNACYTAAQAREINRHIDFVIGTRAPIMDEAATVFAAAFYSALGFGRTIPHAFEQAKAALMVHGLPGHDTPEILARPNAELHLLSRQRSTQPGSGTQQAADPVRSPAQTTADVATHADGTATDQAEQTGQLPQTETRSVAASAAFAVSVTPPLGLRDPRRPLRGRNRLVGDLFDLLMDTSRRPRVQVLHGFGGCGKTSVALELADMAVGNGVRVWWVRASNHRAISAYMQAVARAVGARNIEARGGQSADILWQQLAVFEKRWLLIVDGANDPSLLAGNAELADGTGWIRPHNLLGLVVVTTRDGSPDTWGPWCALRAVGALATEDAIEVLLDFAPPQAGTRAEAAELADRVGGLPLALRLAGSYLAETSTLPQEWAPTDTIRTFATYCQALDAGRMDVLAGRDNASLIEQAWEMSLELLRRRNMPQARSLLCLLSMFADAPLPYQTLLVPEEISASVMFDGVDGVTLWRQLRATADLDLIDLSWRADSRDTDPAVTPPVLRLHPLVLGVSRQHVIAAGQRTAYVTLAAALLAHAASTAGNTPEDPLSWSRWQVLAPHAFQLLHAECTNADLSVETVRQIAGVATLATRHLFGRGLYHAADVEYRFLLDGLKQVLGEDHEDTLSARHGYASLLHDRGLYNEALLEFGAVIEIRTSALGQDHPQTLVARNELAQVLHDSGQRVKAEDEFRSVLSALQRVRGIRDPLTLATRYDLARVLHARHEYDQAEQELRAVIAERRKLFGDDHPDTLVVRGALAYLHHGCGQLQSAESEFRRILDAYRRVLGHDHPKTLATRNNLARVLHDLGQLDEAETELRLVLQERRQALGANHPNTLTTQHNLAWVLKDLGQTSQAEAEFSAVLESRTQVLGSDHPDSHSTQAHLRSITGEDPGQRPNITSQ